VFLLFHLLIYHKKFELMLTRRAKAYSSSCSQTASLSPAISSQFILGVCATAKDRKNQSKPLILEVQSFSKWSILIWLKSLSLVLVVIGSMPMPICNCFHERLANNGKITTFTGVPLFDALVHVSLNIKNRELDSRNLRLILKISLFLVYLNWFRRNSLKSPKNP